VLSVTATSGDPRPVTREKNDSSPLGASSARESVRIREGFALPEFDVPEDRFPPTVQDPTDEELERTLRHQAEQSKLSRAQSRPVGVRILWRSSMSPLGRKPDPSAALRGPLALRGQRGAPSTPARAAPTHENR
jgi:hypothetical protein